MSMRKSSVLFVSGLFSCKFNCIVSYVLITSVLTSCQFTDLRAVLINNKTSKEIKEKSVDESQNGYMKALDLEPLMPAVHSNLGATYDTLKDPEKALKLYKNAEDFTRQELKEVMNRDPDAFQQWREKFVFGTRIQTLFASLYNQGQLLGREKKIDESLQKYQAALELNPESIEVKTNIELMLQQQQGGGQGESDENKDPNQDKKDPKDGKDPKDDKDGDKEKEDKPKNYSSSPKYKPREFKGELNKENVQKIFGEISQQEKKMRAQFSKQNQAKEAPKEKDW